MYVKFRTFLLTISAITVLEGNIKKPDVFVAAFSAITLLQHAGVNRKYSIRRVTTELHSQTSTSFSQDVDQEEDRSKWKDSGNKLPPFFEDLIQSYNEKKPLNVSKEILSQCAKVQDKLSLEAIIDFLISNTISVETNDKDSDGNKVKTTKNLTSLIAPRDQTELIQLLGSRGMFYTMLCFLKQLSINLDRSENKDESDFFYRDIQYAYTAGIKALAQSPNPKYRMRTALLLDDMDELFIPPNSYVITAVFLAVEGGKAARELLERARKYTSVEVDVHVYNAAIYACSRDQLNGWQSALSLFREMPKNGIKPNQQTYASLLQACAKSGQVKVAFSLFDEMKNTSGVDKPAAKVWGAVLRACSIAGEYEKAIKFILDMNTDGVNVNVIHMNSVLASIAKVGDDTMALEVLNYMQKGEAINSLERFVSNRSPINPDDHNRFKQTLPFPDLVSINTVLTTLAERCKKVDAIKLLDRMKDGEFTSKQGPNWVIVKPDIISYNLVLSTFQDPRDGFELLHEVSDHVVIKYIVEVGSNL